MSLVQSVQTGSGARSAVYSMDSDSLSAGVKRPESEANYFPSSNSDFKNLLELSFLSSMCLNCVALNHRDKITFTLLNVATLKSQTDTSKLIH